jgi:hypothetical protein
VKVTLACQLVRGTCTRAGACAGCLFVFSLSLSSVVGTDCRCLIAVDSLGWIGGNDRCLGLFLELPRV